MPRPSALLVVPLLPDSAGVGLAQRAHGLLAALAASHEVDVVIVPVSGAPGNPVPALARRCVTLPISEGLDPLWALSVRQRDPGARAEALRRYPRPAATRFATGPVRARLAEMLAVDGRDYRVLAVLRSYLVPYVEQVLAAAEATGATKILDLDDDESTTRRRLAARLLVRGDAEAAAFEEAEADRFSRLEPAWCRLFDILLTASPEHARVLEEAMASGARGGERGGGPRVAVLPNVAPAWAITAGATAGDDSGHDEQRRRVLLVGNLSYFPNEDAALFLLDEIAPRLRQRLPDVEIVIAGSSPAPRLRRRAAEAGARIAPSPTVEELAREYRAAGLVIAPLLAGGGTRIKILEAFAVGRPVVATTVAAEGLGAIDGEHLWLADHADDLAAACATLLLDPPRAARLAAAARRIVLERFVPERQAAVLRRLGV